jgi:hypothetical protein
MVWDAARSSSNAKECKSWVLACGALWDAALACPYEANIQYTCPPWDYETHLHGKNGTHLIAYIPMNGGHIVRGGQPYYGSITLEVLLNWSFTMDKTSPLYSKLSHRYHVAVGYSSMAELLCVYSFSFMFFFAVFLGDLNQLMDQVSCIPPPVAPAASPTAY